MSESLFEYATVPPSAQALAEAEILSGEILEDIELNLKPSLIDCAKSTAISENNKRLRSTTDFRMGKWWLPYWS